MAAEQTPGTAARVKADLLGASGPFGIEIAPGARLDDPDLEVELGHRASFYRRRPDTFTLGGTGGGPAFFRAPTTAATIPSVRATTPPIMT